MPRYKIFPRQYPGILKKYLAGERVKDIAVEYNVHWGTIYDILNERGIRRRRFKKAEKAQIFALYDNEVRLEVIAALFHTSRRTVSRLLHNRDPEIFPIGEPLNTALPMPVDRRTDADKMHSRVRGRTSDYE